MGDTVRDLGFLKWRDENAWMERMEGPRWKALIDKENATFKASITTVTEDVEAAATSFKAAEDENMIQSTMFIKRGGIKVRIRPHAGYYYSWDIVGKKTKPVTVGDLEVLPDGSIIYTKEINQSGDTYTLIRCHKGKQIWKIKERIGSSVAVIGDRVFVLEERGPLRFSDLVCFSVKTGRDKRIHYEEKSGEISLALSKGEGGCLFLISENAGKQQLAYIRSNGEVIWLSQKGVSFFPVGKGPNYFVRLGSFDAPWTAVGPELESWDIPMFIRKQGIEMVSLQQGIIVTKTKGVRTVYRNGRAIGGFIGEVSRNPWAAWYGQKDEISVTLAGAMPTRVTIGPSSILFPQAMTVYAKARLGRVRDRPVTFALLQNENQAPTALMVCGYGSYGVPYHLDTVRWKTYLEHGWAVALAFIRGGGDDTEAWADAGRREGKLEGIEDFEACIVAAQKMTGLTAKNTCIHGRSAGGYLVGACTSRHPDGDLFRAVYTEVPYVDVLRTASLPELPLTQVEYNEVGNPRKNIYDFEYLLGLSPIDTLTEKGAPGVFVLCRAGTADRQVFAYEPAKWIQTLRGSAAGEKKLLYIARGKGHFSRGDAVSVERGEDFAILQEFMNKKIAYVNIQMAARKMTRRGRKGSRKARKGTRRARRQ